MEKYYRAGVLMTFLPLLLAVVFDNSTKVIDFRAYFFDSLYPNVRNTKYHDEN